jgi:hypothetical protein
MNDIRHQLLVSNWITSHLIRDDLPRFTLITFQKSFEESFGCLAITPFLDIDVDDITILIHSSPKIMLNAINLHKHFIDKDCVTEAITFLF